jgi:hypothetical protein
MNQNLVRLTDFVAFETQRVATAFRIEQLKLEEEREDYLRFSGLFEGGLHRLEWNIGEGGVFGFYWSERYETDSWRYGLQITSAPKAPAPRNRWRLYGGLSGKYNELAARGLCRLGFDDEDILRQLPGITAHEQLELRRSMPREFWLQKWFDEATHIAPSGEMASS